MESPVSLCLVCRINHSTSVHHTGLTWRPLTWTRVFFVHWRHNIGDYNFCHVFPSRGKWQRGQKRLTKKTTHNGLASNTKGPSFRNRKSCSRFCNHSLNYCSWFQLADLISQLDQLISEIPQFNFGGRWSTRQGRMFTFWGGGWCSPPVCPVHRSCGNDNPTALNNTSTPDQKLSSRLLSKVQLEIGLSFPCSTTYLTFLFLL